MAVDSEVQTVLLFVGAAYPDVRQTLSDTKFNVLNPRYKLSIVIKYYQIKYFVFCIIFC